MQLLMFSSSIKLYDTPYINKVPLITGSWLSIHAQWSYQTIQTLITALVTVGLFLGHDWARWLLLAAIPAGWAIAIPLGDTKGVPVYLMSVLTGSIVLGMLFLTPAARAYFSRRREARALFSLRGLFAGALHAFCAINTYLMLMDRFMNRADLLTTIAVLAGLSFPVLLLGMTARWNITAACRDGATTLIATTLFLALLFLGAVISMRAVSPGSLSVFDLKAAPIITAIIAMLGFVLASISTYRARRTQLAMAAAS
ncbi:hypothetical protein WI72_30510 [Burkholderia ubonensis]|uniref:hypothetical protein n=1 Tax=Burkholderia ubonensis TaxID=101571 RepID=UPI000751F8B4|nr:hypothetical protein [Burkholderia ubonensis]KVC48061.1 hypothetical protein WI72_30510 [Burkholderia ubonensis]